MTGNANTVRQLSTRCCVVGGGPAGMMAGYLLARAGIETVVLEKHADFLRDFRGDTVHPSTLELLGELGLLEAFLARPHQELKQIVGRVGGAQVKIADFSHLHARCQFIALMPQWDFLNILAEAGRASPQFHLEMCAEACDLLRVGGRIAGIRAQTPNGALHVHAELTIGADGRSSTVRQAAGLPVQDLGSDIDVLWLRLSKSPQDPAQALGNFNFGRVLVLLDRSDYWQCAYVIRKGEAEKVRAGGLANLREGILRVAPFLSDRVAEITDWEQVKTLTVRIDRLQRWHLPGLLCIGDSAHAMSPIGGVGINLAVQDAVAAANVLIPALRAGQCSVEHLASVQRRREWPTRVTQAVQVFIQKRLIGPALANQAVTQLPLPLKLMNKWPLLQRIPARIIGVGVRPEHIGAWDRQ